ncbi:phosphopantetheine-binding protein, partial [Streptomyces glaucus]|uniref:phosphopantetheine-binding protein n=1 Tax=Streptomyces glaucus TaxID=284029 RepID=UPI0031E2D3A2
AVLDALATARRAQGLPAVSLAWGMWETADGMGGRMADADVARLRRQGFPPLATDEALALLDTALLIDEPTTLPVRLRTSTLAERGDHLPHVLRDLVPIGRQRRAAGVMTADGQTGGLIDRLRELPAEEQERLLLDLVQTQVAAVLGHASAASVDPARAFKDLGFDSLTAVDLRNRLTSATGITLPATLIFDHPTVGTLAGFLRTELGRAVGDTTPTLTDLDRLEAAVFAVADQDDALRKEMRDRLRAMMARLDDEPGAADTEHDNDDIDSASLDSMFAIIDRELEG